MQDKDVFESFLFSAKIHVNYIDTVSQTGNPSEVQTTDLDDRKNAKVTSQHKSLEEFDMVYDHVSSVLKEKDSDIELFPGKFRQNKSFHGACVDKGTEDSVIYL